MKSQGPKVLDLLKLVQRDYKDSGHRTGYVVDLYINNHLLPLLGMRTASLVKKAHVEGYKSSRKDEGASEVTINRELAVLKRAFNLGLEEEIIERKPFIKLYPEPEAREGHYEHDEFLRFQTACRLLGSRKNYDGEVVADIVLFGYYSGWRLRECLGLQKDWIMLQERIAVLPKSKHKNKRPKIYPLEGKVWQMVERRLASPNAEGYLFHRGGKRVLSVRRICATVCDAIEINKDHFFHNLRRSCTTNLNRSGIDKETGKKITGHITDSVYNNYNQHTVENLREAVTKVEAYLDAKEGISRQNEEAQNTENSPEIPTLEKQEPSATENNHTSQEVMAERAGFEPALDVQPKLDFESNNQSQVPESKGILTRLWRIITNT